MYQIRSIWSTRYEAVNGGAKCRKWGGLGALKVIGNVTIRHTTSYSTYLVPFSTYQAGYLSKVTDFDPPHLHSAPLYEVTPVEFRADLWLQKTRVPGLSCGVICVILRLAVLVEHRLVTDRQTQGHGYSNADA